MSDIVPQASPFDQIRKFKPDGTEFWSARDLMPLLGYTTWRRFESSIERAKFTCKNSDQNVNHHFAGAVKVIEGGKGAQLTAMDYELTRYACYLIAMNGDPRKFQIADAQTYFAVQTRKTELLEQQAQQQSFQLPTNYLEALKALVASEEEKEAIKQQHALNAPKVEAFETFMDATGEYLVREVAKMLGTGEKRLFAQLRLAGVMLRDSTEPYQRFVDQGLFVVKARNFTVSGMFGSSERVTKTTYVTAKGVEFIRRLLKKEAQ